METKNWQHHPQGSWKNPVEFVLACLGYSVGLGNVWRFPYLCYRNGGGAFFIPFLIVMITVGVPIFYLELYIGQYTGLSPVKAFNAISPFFSGLGYCSLVIVCIVAVYFMIIVCWTLYYTIISIGFDLHWGDCESEHNSEYCYSGIYDALCIKNNTGTSSDLTYYRRQCTSIGDICSMSGLIPVNGSFCYNETLDDFVPWYSNINRIMASAEYYNQYVLGRGAATWGHWGSIQWHLVGCLFLCWFIAFLCVNKGLQNARLVNYFTALFPYVVLTAMLIRGVTLPGASDGVWYYITPNWSTLLDVAVWRDAASQVFYSFGVASGSLVTLASYNSFYNNCRHDALIVTFSNFLTSVYAGFVVFSVLGFLAKTMGVHVDYVATSGPGLAFVIYPEALLRMPLSRLWSILFFFMMFVMGISSQFAAIDTINAAVVERWPKYINQYWKVTALTCTACFVLGLPLCYSGGVYLFTLLDWNTSSWGILLIGIAECIAVAWSYGIEKALCDIVTMKMKFTVISYWYWKLAWSVVAPAIGVKDYPVLSTSVQAVFGFLMVSWTNAYYEDYDFPLLADLLGALIGISTIVLFPVGIIWAWCRGYRGKALFRPTEEWRPADKMVQRSEFCGYSSKKTTPT